MNIKVFETKNYGMFKRLEGNRDLTSVNKIIDSINSVGYILNPIIVNEKMEVIDGQNRVEALRKLGLPVHYYMVKGATVRTARSLNLGRSNWKPLDYVKSYAESGNESYQLLLKFMDETKLPLQIAHAIIKKRIINGGGNSKCDIHSGELSVTQKEYIDALNIYKYMEACKEALDNIIGSKRVKYAATAWCLGQKNCDKDRFVKIMNYKYVKIRPVTDGGAEYFLQDITKLYNSSLKDASKKVNFDVIFRDL